MATTFDTPIVHGNVFAGMRRMAAWIMGGALALFALALTIALIGHSPTDPSWNQATAAPVRNPLGSWGAGVSDLIYQGFGLAGWIVPLVAMAWAARCVWGRPHPRPFLPLNALPLALLAAAAHLAAIPDMAMRPDGTIPGGLVGYELWSRFAFSMGEGTYSGLTLLLALALTIIASGFAPTEFLGWLLRPRERRSEPVERWDETDDLPPVGQAPPEDEPENDANPVAARLGGLLDGLRQGSDDGPQRRRAAVQESETEAKDLPLFAGGIEREAPSRRQARPSAPAAPKPAPPILDGGNLLRGPQTEDGFRLPGIGLLAPVKPGHQDDLDPVELEMMSRELEKVLDEFGVRGEIVGAKPGPVVTLFELQPAPGTRAARVVNLSEDIARSLSAVSVRVAVVRGRNVIGVELPNPVRDTVFLKEILAAEQARNPKIRLGICLGKDISGQPVIADLARMPHLLIAGTTGSGKSVSINAMILSLLYRHTPAELRMIMIDPKVIELSVYDGIPHLLSPVVTEPAKAVVALKWAVRQMDHRYRLMSHLGVRDVHAYNRRLQDASSRGEELTRRVQVGYDSTSGLPQFEEQPIDMTPLPQIVIVVDEVADLMLTAGKEVEAQIQRLSQKARAAGIHLIVATQRPSVDVLTGVIKANMPCRVSFRVSSKIDSRTILGEPGAEQLLGQGDMLYLMSPEPPQRIHGPLVTDAEVERVVDHLKTQGHPEYLDAVTNDETPSDAAPTGSNIDTGAPEDDQYQEALQIVAAEQRATTSFLQRKMRIGYNTAARLIERMQEDGYVSEADHVGRRQILVGREAEDEDV